MIWHANNTGFPSQKRSVRLQSIMHKKESKTQKNILTYRMIFYDFLYYVVGFFSVSLTQSRISAMPLPRGVIL